MPFINEIPPASGGGSQPGVARVLGPFPFAFNTAAINNGLAFYTPAIGDVLLDAWVDVNTIFDGTTPQADIGPFLGGETTGVFGNWNVPLDLTLISSEAIEGFLNHENGGVPSAELAGAAFLNGGHTAVALARVAPGKFTQAAPWKIVVSQDGTLGGTAVGGTAGAGSLYVVVATPSLT